MNKNLQKRVSITVLNERAAIACVLVLNYSITMIAMERQLTDRFSESITVNALEFYEYFLGERICSNNYTI